MTPPKGRHATPKNPVSQSGGLLVQTVNVDVGALPKRESGGFEQAMDRGRMTLRGRQRVVQVVRQVHRILPGVDPNPVALMDDGGVSLMFVDPLSQRELVYIVPSDGAAVWAFVEATDGTKRDFAIEDDGQYLVLARWLQAGSAELPS